jgi:hypothetical protein
VREVWGVARYGEPVDQCRWVRIESGWLERGARVNDNTQPVPWQQLGLCWANGQHAVISLGL